MTTFVCAAFDASNFLFALLLAVLGMLAVAVCVMSLMLLQRRKADVRMMQKHVYVKETWAKTLDCAKSEKNSDNKTKADSAQKKLRHGKKNKLAKAQNAKAKNEQGEIETKSNRQTEPQKDSEFVADKSNENKSKSDK